MQIKRIFCVIALLTIGYWSVVNAQTPASENFNTFFRRFSSDAAFQKSRIKFPLAVVTIEDDDSKTTKIVSASKWEFYNIQQLKRDKENIFKITYPVKNQAIMNRQLADTGVCLELIFKKISGKWQMIQVKDSST